MLLDALQIEIIADLIMTRLEKRLSLNQDKWLDLDQVKSMLHISSSTTIQDLRDKGLIRFSKINARTILYDKESIVEYIEQRVKNKF